jgi:hypothetical protein
LAIGDNSYGSAVGVAAMVPRWPNSNGVFDATTRPNLATVEDWLDQVSALLNTILAENGFAVPVSQATARLALDMFANEEVAAMSEGVNGSGRFGPTAKQGGKAKGRFALILDDVETFIGSNAAGFERLGAARSFSRAGGIGFRDANESGEATFPIFQREQFGNSFTDWEQSP